MTKCVEFHQAEITTTVRIIEGDKSHGLQRFSTTILLNTNGDWTDARQRIDKTLEQLQEQLDDGDGD